MSEADPDIEYLDDIRRLIDEYDFAIQDVPAGQSQVGYQYTVGLYPVVGHEFVVLAVPRYIGVDLLNRLGTLALTGTSFHAGMLLSGVYPNPVTFIDVVTRCNIANARPSVANAIYRTMVPALQLVLADRDGLWPWQNGSRLMDMPLAGPVPWPPPIYPTAEGRTI